MGPCKSCLGAFCCNPVHLRNGQKNAVFHFGKSCEDFEKTRETAAFLMKQKDVVTCPKCNYKWQFGGGCNHIVCGRDGPRGPKTGVGCDYEFCLKCLKPWKDENGKKTCDYFTCRRSSKIKKPRKSRTRRQEQKSSYR